MMFVSPGPARTTSPALSIATSVAWAVAGLNNDTSRTGATAQGAPRRTNALPDRLRPRGQRRRGGRQRDTCAPNGHAHRTGSVQKMTARVAATARTTPRPGTTAGPRGAQEAGWGRL